MSEFEIKRRPVKPAPATKKVRLNKSALYGLIGLVLLLLGALMYRFQTAEAKLQVTTQKIVFEQPAAPAKPLAWPTYGQAAIATESQGVVATHGEQVSHPTASTAKLITMLAVSKKKPIEPGTEGPTLTLTQADVDLYKYYIANNGSNAKVEVGEKITQYQAMQAVLLVSSNNLADTLAIWAFGSLKEYQAYASELLAEYGLKQTVIGDDASGLHPSTTSTAHDLARIGLKAFEDPLISDITGQRQATIPVAGTIYNTNRLLQYDDVTGLKTGETVEAGGVFVLGGTQEVDGHTQKVVVAVVGATLGQVAMNDSYALFKSTAGYSSWQTFVHKGQKIGEVTTNWRREPIAVVAKEDIAGFTWSNQVSSQKAHLEQVQAPLAAQQSLGSLEVTHGNVTARTPVQLATTLDGPTIWWRLGQALPWAG